MQVSASQLPGDVTTGNSKMPKNVQILTKLANSLSESYQLVKQRQQKYKELTTKMGGQNSPQLLSYNQQQDYDNDGDDANAGEWQEVKNKLKRKKKLSTSLTSVNDSVNQEKRTRIEGIQLNCRGRLNITELTATRQQHPHQRMGGVIGAAQRTNERLVGIKSPTPSSSSSCGGGNGGVATISVTNNKQIINKIQNAVPSSTSTPDATSVTTAAAPPPRLKRKLQENVQTIQKLNALTEQLRLEINELKSNLTTERGAVRVLRAQNESETRKWKNEIKRLQNALEFSKKTTASPVGILKKPTDIGNDNQMPNASLGNINLNINHEVQRLTNEVTALKEANKALEDKKMINCDADRRKAADMRTLKDSYEIRLTQLKKSAKNEISRLLEEIKTKERNIGQLKKELQTHQTRPQSQVEAKSRNATTNQQQQTTNKITKPKKINNKINKANPTNNRLNETNASASALAKKTEDSKDTTIFDGAQHPNEVKKLKDIELINNTRNLQINNIKTTTPTFGISNDKPTAAIIAGTELTTTNQILTNTQNNLKLKSLQNVNLNLNVNVDNEQIHNINNNNNLKSLTTITKTTTTLKNNENCNNLLKTTTLCTPMQVNDVKEELIHEETEEPTTNATTKTNIKMCTTTIASSAPTTTTTTQTTEVNEQHHNDMHDDRTKDNNSDADSALSSAPPSISPQPPPTGLDTADIWQMIRTYSTDLQKLQKDNEILQKENEHLHAELNLAKEQILDAEKLAIEVNNNGKLQQLIARVKKLEEREHQLSTEADELREQNELLEFRILELEETNDKWSLQSHTTTSNTSQTATIPTAKNVWSNHEDPMQMIFGKCGNGETNMDSGIISPNSQQNEEDEMNLMDPANEELRRRLMQMLKKSTLDNEDKHCLQQIIQLVQHLDLMTQRSGPNSLNTASCSSDEANSLDLVKSRISDYSSASSPSSAHSVSNNSCNSNNNQNSKLLNKSSSISATTLTNAARIVATISPYNSSPQHQGAYNNNSNNNNNHNSGNNNLVPTNTPTDSPRKSRQSWQTTSLSESGVFVESDFLSDISENNVCTQTDFDEEEQESVTQAARGFCNELQKLRQTDATTQQRSIGIANKVPVYTTNSSPYSTNLSEQKQLQYYKERLALLESKVLIYESSGDLQAKHLADRLQREILLEKELKELRDRVEFLESENLTLEEEKCEFEEAENDTRLRLQRLEVDLEILSQRNVELEMSREALSAKYKDCRSECLNLRDDLAASEQQIRHLDEDKQKAKENLEIFHNLLPLLLTYHTTLALTQLTTTTTTTTTNQSEYMKNMGNIVPIIGQVDEDGCQQGYTGTQYYCNEQQHKQQQQPEISSCVCQYLKEEVKSLRNQIKDLNCRHYEAMESADTHWVELERQYKDREEAHRAKECSLKCKIQKLQDCLRDDARAANEKICQLEEAERDLKNCLVRVSKEHRDLLNDHQFVNKEYEQLKEQLEALNQRQKPTIDQLEQEKKRNKVLTDEVSFMRKLQQETEARNLCEMESLQSQLFELKKEFLHIEVTNSELKEEVVTLEQQIEKLQSNEKECEDKIRILQDEVRSKEEMVQKLEKRLERSEGYSLAQELSGSPSKRFKREDVKDLRTASAGLGNALRNFKECETNLPSHQQFTNVARDVKRLADSLLHGDDDDEALQRSAPKLILTDITRI